MSSDITPPAPRPLLLRAVRHHVLVVVWCLVNGLLIGWLLASSQQVTYASTAHVLVNPTVGNPFAPAPSSVRQDEVTSLETEAQVARSAEVLSDVAADNPQLTLRELQRATTISLPPNSQVLEMTYTASDAATAQQLADAWSVAYLANRDRRALEVNAERMARVESQTQDVVDDLRAATAAAQRGGEAERLFQTELASALRNELVSLRAQRSYLENSEAPAGSVISPASPGSSTAGLTPLVLMLGGAFAGLVLGCLIAVALERFAGVVRSAPEVEEAGLPVIAAVPARGWGDRLRRTPPTEGVDATIRRLRAKILDLDPSPEIIAVAPPGARGTDAVAAETVAQSFAQAGHRVVLVRADGPPTSSGLEVEQRGLAEALLHERLNVHEMLQPSVEPLLCLLPWGLGTASTELFVADRLRTVLRPLVEAGHLVIIQAPSIDSAEGEAVVGAADLGLVVVTVGRTRARDVAQLASDRTSTSTALGALVVGARSMKMHGRGVGDASRAAEQEPAASLARDPAAEAKR
ncbi:hypothetical protein [Nocardioides terrigena]|uniref:hypothetical protein n=1 Tax=Nocardioides terrigena TaxID=424797 RepID=UPI00131F349E|nr:hypothetical protein [Nocardioides terrigena]